MLTTPHIVTNHFTLNLPPVIERELRVASRKPMTHWGRVAAGGAGAAVICFVMAQQLASAPPAILGQVTFRILGGMTALIVLTSVLQLASEAFAREKREDTLGLLFLTPLRPFDIVLGKLASTSLSAFYQFLAVIPVLAVPLLAGGVSATDFALLVLGLVNLVFVGATLGLWVSALCWDERRAATWALSIIVTLLALPAVLAVGIGAGMNRPAASAIAMFSPGFAIWQALTPRTSGALVLGSVVWPQLLGWIFFYAACRTLPRCWQKRPENLAPKADHLQPSAKLQPSAGPMTPRKDQSFRKRRRRQFSHEERAALLNRNPLAWFALRWRPPASSTWAVAVIAATCYLPAALAGVNANEWSLLVEPGYALIVIFLVNMGIKTFAAHQASFTFARDRGEDTMELLLSTPNTARDLIDGHAYALRETLRPVVRRALWIESAWLAITIAIHVMQHGREPFLYALGGTAMLALLVPDVRALMWTAMWQSVVKKNARDAQQETFSSVVFLPWLPVIVATVLGTVFDSRGMRGGILALVISWLIVSVVADRHYCAQSRHNLEGNLALWAVRRSAGEFEHYDGWKNFGRTMGRWWALRTAPRPRT